MKQSLAKHLLKHFWRWMSDEPQQLSPAEDFVRRVKARWNVDAGIVPTVLQTTVATAEGVQVVWPALLGAWAIAPWVAVLRFRVVVGRQVVGDIVAAADALSSLLDVPVLDFRPVENQVNCVDVVVGYWPTIEETGVPDGWSALVPARGWRVYVGVAAEGLSAGQPSFMPMCERSGAIVSGAPGSGKTVLLRRMVAELLAAGATGAIVDFKAAGDYDVFADAVPIVADMDGALEEARRAVDDMESRQDQLRRSGIGDFWQVADRYAPRFLVVDEVQEGLDATGADKERKAQVAEFEMQLTRLAKRGRSAGMFLILGSQKITADSIPTRLRDALPLRASGFQATAEAARAAVGELRDGQPRPDQLPSDVPGRLVLAEGSASVVVQVPPMPDDAEVRQWLGAGAGPVAQAA